MAGKHRILVGQAMGMCLASILWLAGCGGSQPFSTVPVSGKVMYEDGSLIPAPQIQVMFVPQVPPVDKKT
jgi:hypothetical protein